ncbi:predicted protein [Thalassiosira pseudonana CCMP1335]|uniref:Uncharacterized protein n=1 Tax=Thalassiosira pseudonana TaxID=35128 RepID=B8BQ84_THAPS|nr:predicted protein [Thalassiosira pseudonana CCMP1335]EED95739.1 predicted protein [Thalassiosira pseudonana CCMP1335]
MSHPSTIDSAAALSLCALGKSRNEICYDAADGTTGSVSPPPPLPPLDDSSFHDADHTLTVPIKPSNKPKKTRANASSSKKPGARKASNSAKQKDSKRDTVPFHEMERLMKVYGPTKCLRNRSKTTEKEPKADSVRRKFYRWFPDFEERFIKTDAGWYIAKIGHEEEVAWRAEMRKADQDDLVQKRQARRISKWGISGVKLDGSCKLV